MTPPDRKALPWILVPLLALSVWCGGTVYHVSAERAALKTDASSVNSIKYGLLSVDLWRDNIQQIVSGSIGEFALTPDQENDLRKVVTNVLQALVDDIETFQKKREKTFTEQIQKLVVGAFINTDDIRKRVPTLTQSIIDEIKKPGNKSKLKHLAQRQLDTYSEKSYDNKRDPGPLNRTLTKYETTSPDEFNAKTKGLISALDHQAAMVSRVMLGCLGVFLAIWWWVRKNAEVQPLLFTFGVTLAGVFLLTSVLTPMMEIDARIEKLDIVLVGKHLTFLDQVLFYRSKSILQVVKTMLETGQMGTGVVGVLIFLFSILFPVSKLVSAEAYLVGNAKVRANPWIQFFAFKSGKWSMADVMVIAMFMAYIGFNGILDSQLQNLNFKSDSLECVSTSGTSLQPGCMLFVAFVLFGLFLSFMLDRISEKPQE